MKRAFIRGHRLSPSPEEDTDSDPGDNTETGEIVNNAVMNIVQK